MPVCGWGGARCTAGPGAAGDAATVHAHEVTYHKKKDTTAGSEYRGCARLVLPATKSQFDPCEQYLVSTRTKARETRRTPPTAQRRSKQQECTRNWNEERKKGNK